MSMLAAFLLVCGVIVTSATTAQAAPPDSHHPATWNMNQSSSRWPGVYSLTEHHDVVALQEVPLNAPSASERLRDIRGIERYRWRESARDPYRYLFILRHPSRNIGMVTRWQPSNIYEILSVYRPALAVAHRGDGVLFASVHAESPGGNDTGALLRRIAHTARVQNLRWAALGDFNRRPEAVPTLRDLPRDYRIYSPGQATHANGGEYDYMISNVDTDNWQGTVGANSTSDHWPVQFGSLQAGGEPVEFTMHTENNDMLVGAQSTRINAPVIQTRDDGDTSRWRLIRVAANSRYAIMNMASRLCIDLHYPRIPQRWYAELQLRDCDADAVSQQFVLEHPDRRLPNLTAIGYPATATINEVASISRGDTREGAQVALYPLLPSPYAHPAALPFQSFYLHPHEWE
ncbi:endonuclease/exonuclease/phosphatase family protein [Streptomyces sp. NPDC046931]|uniref:endonuclease/exonuclease/phosphatase family protein n=1 Tax=Streptomyces sp. NPDC046931 TaxID=3154806 RepID=UPI0033E48469